MQADASSTAVLCLIVWLFVFVCSFFCEVKVVKVVQMGACYASVLQEGVHGALQGALNPYWPAKQFAKADAQNAESNSQDATA